jgi:phosphoenolpyruvate-protein kinase (PTS system EI component)
VSEDLSSVVRQALVRIDDRDAPASVGDVLMSVPASIVGGLLHASFESNEPRRLLTTGLGASPGAASGAIVFAADDAVAAADAGRAVILVRPETTPDDVLGMQAARGILTLNGGFASHAAVVARGWGIPAVVGAGELSIEAQTLICGGQRYAAGDEISIDGRTGEVFVGGMSVRAAAPPVELERLLEWADFIRASATRPVSVRANADTGADAVHARQMGAEGIGLCRTEHMFLADDRLALMRRLILTNDADEERAALNDLEIAQQQDFEDIFSAMEGLPVTVRLLDPPLHEFLPSLERLLVAEARGELTPVTETELAGVRRMHETNPMIGTRGVRLGVVKPGVYQMQVRAICRAIARVAEQGKSAHVEVMIPLVVGVPEMRSAQTWIQEAVSAVGLVGHHRESLSVGAMIETPRAAIVAGDLTEVSDFFSFGTNDLTQMTFAFSRDDVGTKLLPAYLQAGLLEADPFETLDVVGVGRLVRDACTQARSRRESIKLGVCGEHAGDPASISFFVDCGVDYVSCSPYRVPVARLAVAQALIAAGRVDSNLIDAYTASQRIGATVEEDTVEEGTVEESTVEVPASDSAKALDSAHEYAVLHALSVKGFSTVEGITEFCGVEQLIAEQALAQFLANGFVRHLAARNLWQMLPPGRERHGVMSVDIPADQVAGLRQFYNQFLATNLAFKDLCTSWQVRADQPNDHTDEAYDTARIGDLAAMHASSLPFLDGFATAMPRFDQYRRRLAAALERTSAGETKMFTGVMCGSFHDVWMELHEDLIQLLGVDRHAEGSF